MAGLQLPSVFTLFVFFPVVRVSGECVNLADSVLLTVKGVCAGDDMQLVRVRRTDARSRAVANRVGGVWQPAEAYRHRIHHVSTSSVKLTGLNFNDDALYEFTCNREPITITDVTVIFPYDVRVSEGETARVPCYSPTEGLQEGGARWERDGELVLEQDRASGQPEGRLSVSPDWAQTGNLSLIMNEAQLEDAGNYVCYTVDGNGKKARGIPDAVKVTVQNRPAPTGAPLHPTPTPAEKRIGPGLIVSIIFNVLLCLAAAFFLWWRVRVRKAKTLTDEASHEGTS